MKSALFVCLCIPLALATTRITLKDLVINGAQNASQLNYPDFAMISLLRPNIEELTVDLLLQLKVAIKLMASKGRISTIHLTPQFKAFEVTNCDLNLIVIDPEQDYRFVRLDVRANNLTAVPNHINRLSKLQSLDLSKNKIKYVNFGDFDGLTKLDIVSLADNEIAQVQTSLFSAINLPKLSYLDLSRNALANITFKHWNVPSLVFLNLGKNSLKLAYGLTTSLPKLEGVVLQGNRLNCEWLYATVEDLLPTNVTLAMNDMCEESQESMQDLIEELRTSDVNSAVTEMERENYKLLETVESLKNLVGKMKNLEFIINSDEYYLQNANTVPVEQLKKQIKQMKGQLHYIKTKI